MKNRPQLLAFVLGAFCAFAAPSAAHAQVGVNVQIGHPAWGPAEPAGTQYYYVPEIDGYYDLYAQQYIVLRNGQWLPVAALSGYDPYQFRPVIVDYRGPQPWLRVDYYRQRYAYQPYRHYGPGRGGYYSSYGYNGYGGYNRSGPAYSNGRSYNGRDGYRGNDNRNGYNPPRGNPQTQGGGYNPGPGQNPGNNGGGRGNNSGYGGSHGNSRSRN